MLKGVSICYHKYALHHKMDYVEQKALEKAEDTGRTHCPPPSA